MSEKFGINWKKYELKRMTDFLLIMKIQNEIKVRQSKQQSHGRNNH